MTNHFDVGEGDKAQDYLVDWINENAKDSLIIYDPYFSENELDLFLKIFLKENISIISSYKDIEKRDLVDRFKKHWDNICTQAPPSISFIMLTAPNADTPMHDRYVIGDTIGLELGTSINGFGNKYFKIIEMDELQTDDKLKNLIYSTMKTPPKTHKNHAIVTHKFYLD